MVNDKSAQNIVCILDALDECAEYEQILKKLVNLALSSVNFKILVTSRPYATIETILFDGTELSKDHSHLVADEEKEKSHIKEEIDIFIESKILHFEELRISKGIKDDAHKLLRAHLAEIENSTYIWVAAIFSQLDRAARVPRWKLAEIIRTLPEDVESAYQSILDQCYKL